MYEHHKHPVAPPAVFRARLVRNAGMAGALLGGALALGVGGYHYFAELEWIDALLNAAMILGGMGPVDPIRTGGGKVFASVYALLCGIAFLGASAVVIAPVYHRFLHRFHAAED